MRYALNCAETLEAGGTDETAPIEPGKPLGTPVMLRPGCAPGIVDILSALTFAVWEELTGGSSMVGMRDDVTYGKGSVFKHMSCYPRL